MVRFRGRRPGSLAGTDQKRIDGYFARLLREAIEVWGINTRSE